MPLLHVQAHGRCAGACALSKVCSTVWTDCLSERYFCSISQGSRYDRKTPQPEHQKTWILAVALLTILSSSCLMYADKGPAIDNVQAALGVWNTLRFAENTLAVTPPHREFWWISLVSKQNRTKEPWRSQGALLYIPRLDVSNNSSKHLWSASCMPGTWDTDLTNNISFNPYNPEAATLTIPVSQKGKEAPDGSATRLPDWLEPELYTTVQTAACKRRSSPTSVKQGLCRSKASRFY